MPPVPVGRAKDDPICGVIMRWLRAHPGESMHPFEILSADDPAWGDVDPAPVTTNAFMAASWKLIRARAVVFDKRQPLTFSAGSHSRGPDTYAGVWKIKLNPARKQQKQPPTRFVLPKVESTGAPTPMPKSRPEKPKPAPPKPAASPAPAPAPPIDITQDMLQYTRAALAILRQYGDGQPWQTIGKHDMVRLVRPAMPGLSKSNAQRLIDILAQLGFVRTKDGIHYVSAQGELTPHMLRGAGLRLKETPEELRAELAESYKKIRQVELQLQRSQEINAMLRQDNATLQALLNEASDQIDNQQRELGEYQQLLDQAPSAPPPEATGLDPQLRARALQVIQDWT